MAAVAGTNSAHTTLTATTADTVTLAGSGESLAVTNRDASVTLWFRMDATAAVAEADENYVVLPLQTKVIESRGIRVISVVGNGNAYSVELW